jgi:hypothetical protein
VHGRANGVGKEMRSDEFLFVEIGDGHVVNEVPRACELVKIGDVDELDGFSQQSRAGGKWRHDDDDENGEDG